jgi:hypothetical protein
VQEGEPGGQQIQNDKENEADRDLIGEGFPVEVGVCVEHPPEER